MLIKKGLYGGIPKSGREGADMIAQNTVLIVMKDALKELERLNASPSIIKRMKILLIDTIEKGADSPRRV